MRNLTSEELNNVKISSDYITNLIGDMCTTDSVTDFVLDYQRCLRELENIRAINTKRLFTLNNEEGSDNNE